MRTACYCLSFVLTLACTDLGPDRAKVERIAIYACMPAANTATGCTAGATLTEPPRDGTRFLSLVRAPGAWLLEDQLHYPSDLVAEHGGTYVGTRVEGDSIMTSWAITCATCTWLYLKVMVRGPGTLVYDADSVVWRW